MNDLKYWTDFWLLEIGRATVILFGMWLLLSFFAGEWAVITFYGHELAGTMRFAAWLIFAFWLGFVYDRGAKIKRKLR